MEKWAKSTVSEIRYAETLRAKLNVAGRERRVVRPLDVGGPLGEAERFVSDIQIAERKRAIESRSGEGESGPVRPMDAAVKGPLGEVEEKAVGLVEGIKEEERKRYR